MNHIEYASDVPEWMRSLLENALHLFGGGFSEWRIEVSISDAPNGRDTSEGACWISDNHFHAKIYFNRSLADDPDGRATVVHEALEMAYSQIRATVETITESVPAEARDLAETLYHRAVEHFIERTAQSIVRSGVLDEGAT